MLAVNNPNSEFPPNAGTPMLAGTVHLGACNIVHHVSVEVHNVSMHAIAKFSCS